jgi:hypothetical protein
VVVRLLGRHMKTERVREPVDHVEQERDLNGISDFVDAETRAQVSVHLIRTQRDLLDEPERRMQRRPDGRGPPVGQHRLREFLSERNRRDRAVGARSEGALVEARREGSKQLTFAHRPRRRAP